MIKTKTNVAKKSKPNSEHFVNEQIPHPKLFVIGPDDEKIGILTRNEALEKAKEFKMDLVLVCVEPKPIARILDYGKFKYNRKKKQKDEKAKQTRVENKQIRLTPLIGDNDIKIKAKKAREFILDGNVIKVSLKFRGREMQRQELGYEVLAKFFKEVEDIAIESKPITLNGRFLDMYLQQDKKKVIIYKNKKDLENKMKEGENNAKNEN